MVGVYTTPELVAKFLGTTEAELTAKFTDIDSRIARIEEYIDNRLGTTWKTKSISEEYHTPIYTYSIDGWLVNTNYRPIIQLTKLEVWNGSEWEDWLSTKTEGRDKDYWIDKQGGRIFLFMGFYWWVWRPDKMQVRIGYTYGRGATEDDRSAIPKDLEDVATKLVVIDLLETEGYVAVTPTGERMIDYQSRVNKWKEEIEDWFTRNQEWKSVDIWR